MPSVLRIFFCAALFGVTFALPARGQRVSGSVRWLADTVAVGRPIGLEFKVLHPSGTEAILPNESSEFGYWTVLDREPAEYGSENGQKTTTVRYRLATFEVRPVQGLWLPIRVLAGTDTLRARTDSVSVRLNARVPNPSPELNYKPDLGLAEIDLPVNWLLVGILTLTLGCFAGLGYLLLRAPYRRWRTRKRLTAEYAGLLALLNQLPSHEPEPAGLIRTANAAWKTYLEKAWRRPLRSLTQQELGPALAQASSEIPGELQAPEALLKLQALEYDLHFAHRKVAPEALQTALQRLRPVLQHVYQTQLARVS